MGVKVVYVEFLTRGSLVSHLTRCVDDILIT